MSTDHESILQEAQKEFLMTGSREAMSKIWEVSFTVCQNIAASWCLSHNITFDQELIDDKSMIACEYVLRRFDKTYFESAPKNFKEKYPDGYKIGNFISTLKSGIKHAFLYVNRNDKDINDSTRFEQVDAASLDKIIGEVEFNKRIVHVKKGTFRKLQIQALKERLDDEQKIYYSNLLKLYYLKKQVPESVQNYYKRISTLEKNITSGKILIDSICSMIY